MKGEMIAKGTFGKVYEAFDKCSGQLLAIKTLKLSSKTDVAKRNSELTEIMNEISILS